MIIYKEPEDIAVANKIYESFSGGNKGNIVSLLSDAMRQLRQLGPAGLDLWIKLDSKNRCFITKGMNNADFDFDLEVSDFDTAWVQTQKIMKVLCSAKYYAKTRKE